MILNLFLLVVGIAMLLGGGDILVRGASAIAKGLGIPPLVIGLTIVAFGTSAPELSINLLAAFNGNTEISFGNIIGSNIANIGLILGISALIKPLSIKGVIIAREIPMMVLASVLTLIAGLDLFLRDAPNLYDRSDGLILLLIFSVFLFYTIGDVLFKKGDIDPLLQEVGELSERKGFKFAALNLLLFAGGLVILVFGGRLTVDAAVAIAELLNIPQVIIGLTIIAVGTSLPELVTSAVATFKGHTDIAIGNVVGSNLFNLLLVCGLSASIFPIPVPAAGGIFDLLMMVFLSILLLPLCVTDKKVDRWEGGLLLLFYFGFSAWRVFSS